MSPFQIVRSSIHVIIINIILITIFLLHTNVHAQLNPNYYERTCPHLCMVVQYNVWSAMQNDPRMAASLLRMHFHDCFVDGCEASVLLDDTADMKGEKHALPNNNSLRGYEVIDSIKADLEKYCPYTVSCADIVALAARDAVTMSGGPYWEVPLGRRDGLTAREKSANEQLPSPFEPLDNIIAKFASKGLDVKDVVVLSGGHTIGSAQCFTFKRRLFDFNGSGRPDPTLDSSFLASLQTTCPKPDVSNSNLAPLDATNKRFDGVYYSALISNSGLLESDQALAADRRTASMVYNYANDPDSFWKDFGASMVRLGSVGVITGGDGQIRSKCGSVN